MVLKDISHLLQCDVWSANNSMRHFPIIVAAMKTKSETPRHFSFPPPVRTRLFLLDLFRCHGLSKVRACCHDAASITLRHIRHYTVHVEDHCSQIRRKSTQERLQKKKKNEKQNKAQILSRAKIKRSEGKK